MQIRIERWYTSRGRILIVKLANNAPHQLKALITLIVQSIANLLMLILKKIYFYNASQVCFKIVAEYGIMVYAKKNDLVIIISNIKPVLKVAGYQYFILNAGLCTVLF